MTITAMKVKHTLLEKSSPYHPCNRRKETVRYANPEFQVQANHLLGILSKNYPVSVLQNDSLVVAIVRGAAMNQAMKSDNGEWVMSGEEWGVWTGLKRRRLDMAKKILMTTGELTVTFKDFPKNAYYQCFYPQGDRKEFSRFYYHSDLSHILGHDATALFGWLLERDKQFEAKGYFFHLKIADIQQSLGLSRYQVDQARKKLIEHDLLKERFWGIPAVREFRLRLDGLRQLVSEKRAPK
ncbi:MAG: hypothetical protein JAY60_18050 [Candidatus Thiodiazotropha weberae]|nr:hypothetical protein [Candidatus Thiodiazotropha weberae]